MGAQSTALVRLTPPGRSTSCHVEIKNVPFALPQELHLLSYLALPFLETLLGNNMCGVSRSTLTMRVFFLARREKQTRNLQAGGVSTKGWFQESDAWLGGHFRSQRRTQKQMAGLIIA